MGSQMIRKQPSDNLTPRQLALIYSTQKTRTERLDILMEPLEKILVVEQNLALVSNGLTQWLSTQEVSVPMRQFLTASLSLLTTLIPEPSLN
jgi:hypothetical protein